MNNFQERSIFRKERFPGENDFSGKSHKICCSYEDYFFFAGAFFATDFFASGFFAAAFFAAAMWDPPPTGKGYKVHYFWNR